METVRTVNAAGLLGTWPEIVILLELDPAIGLARQAIADRIGAEGVDFQRKVGETFTALAAMEPDVFRIVPADRALDEVVDAVINEVDLKW